MRQSAWLHAVPVEAAPKSRALNAADKPAPVSRLAAIEARGGEPLLPPLERGAWLLQYFWEIGPVEQGGMAAAPLSHTEIAAWQSNTGIALAPWEARQLRRLSQDYINEGRRAEKPDCPPPWGAPDMQFDRALVAKKIGITFKALARSKRGAKRKGMK